MFFPWMNQSNYQYAAQPQHNQCLNYQEQSYTSSSYLDRSSMDFSTTPFGDQEEHDEVTDPSDSLHNKRERFRVKQMNAAFDLLREHLPNPDAINNQTSGKRLKSRRRNCRRISKVKTLRLAVQYINDLLKILEDLNRA
ncbi:unnamed protein product [Rodentolepis nana]|uniref:BHLH domain-containing protein n=1 Tax=Rodentolepis nana TaxID=102285 RepID=A0A0R3TF23_RODNA|nr:unnamed protein product [Rodentolepis nana]